MNPSTALARVLVDELVRGGVTEAVLSPGSRSAPLAFALYDADREGRLRLHVQIDERSAAFLALGLAKASGRPVPVVTTSGTAAANLHPAVLEASYAHVPLMALTADRPPELRGTGANQTVDQVKLFGDAVRLFVEVGAPEAGQEGYWRGMTCRALSAALGDLGTAAGPVHLNLALREPLVPDAVPGEDLGGRPAGAPWTARVPLPAVGVDDDLPDRTVVVLGDTDAVTAAAALRLAQARGWPVVAEPSAGASGASVVAAAELVVGTPGWVERHRPDRVLVVGRPTLSRAVGRLVASAPSDVVATVGSWSDPARRASRVLPAVPCPGTGADPSWLEPWLAAGRAARAVVDEQLTGLSEPVVAAEVMAAAAELVVVGSSKPVRDLFLAGGREGVRVLANRGAAGIDGTVSTAMGAALAHGGQTYALLGDLTFLHDANGLVVGPDEPRPDLTVVVVNNDGGAIFGLLEQGAPEHAGAFERVFGTPHGVDLGALCQATATPYTRAESREALRSALAVTGAVRVVEVRTDRHAAVELDRRLRAAVAALL
ncbi:MAG: 2-succinyl-5-enolpyruvyl-6-hydroxy-3-cyclohexene-1-carboxylic-acid synthase [Mycobacteriales bacterium]